MYKKFFDLQFKIIPTDLFIKMELEEEFMTKPVDIFISLQKLLAYNGCIPFIPKRRNVNICYQMYRVFAYGMITLFVIHDFVSIYTVRCYDYYSNLLTYLHSQDMRRDAHPFWMKI